MGRKPKNLKAAFSDPAESEVVEIQIPALGWQCREYQKPIWNFFENGGKRAIVVWHRRAGKDLFAVNRIVWETTKRPGYYWHVFPYLKQGRSIVWEGYTKDGKRFIDYFPRELIDSINNTDMRINFKNGSTYQVMGADNPDRLVGPGPVGVVFSEAALMSKYCYDLIRPILNENDGWALFISTPRGGNWFKTLYDAAKEMPNWFCEMLTIDKTYQLDSKGNKIPIVSKETLDEERKTGMSDALIKQEYYCSFDQALDDAYYGEFITAAEEGGRVCSVPFEPKLDVYTAWDIGVGDSAVILFFQTLNNEIRIIDAYSNSGEGLPHYARILHQKAVSYNYKYGKHFFPWDMSVREFSTGKERILLAKTIGIRPTAIVLKHQVEDGIEWARNLFPNVWFDKQKCAVLVEALKSYRKQYNEAKGISTAVHDKHSHWADAFRYLCWTRKPPSSINLSKTYSSRPNRSTLGSFNYDPFSNNIRIRNTQNAYAQDQRAFDLSWLKNDGLKRISH